MKLSTVFNQKNGSTNGLEEFISQIFTKEAATISSFDVSLEGTVALKTFVETVQNRPHQGGVFHYQRILNSSSQQAFFATVIWDLYQLESMFGSIKRINGLYKISSQGESAQLFVTLRLNNQVIVQYGLSAQPAGGQQLKLDFSSRGFNLDYDSRLRVPILLNGQKIQSIQPQRTTVTETLKESISRISNLLENALSSQEESR